MNMKTSAWTLAPMMISAVGCAPKGVSPKVKTPVQPNVVLIVADDLGIGDIGCYGSRAIPTPNLDTLASRGLVFNHAYATSATSSPSRYGLFTGMYPFRANMAILPGDSPLMIPAGTPTLPKMMQAAGYTTGAVGKWHLGMGDGFTDWNKPVSPSANTVGFDFTHLIPATVDRVPTVYVENGLVQHLDPEDPIEISYRENFPGEPTALTNPELMTMPWDHGHQGTIVNGIPRIGYMKGGHAARWKDDEMADHFLAQGKRFVEENAGKGPFFLYYGLHEPHVPRVPASRFVGTTDLGPRGDHVVEADWCVGEFLRFLDRKGLLDNTLVIVTSDNGAVVQDGYKDEAEERLGDHDPHGGLRGGKYSLFDGGPHIPMIVYWKGHVTAGVSDAFVNQMDLFASLGHLVGGTVAEGLDSQDHLDAFLGRKRRIMDGRKAMYLEATSRIEYLEVPYVLIPPYKGRKVDPNVDIELGNLDGWGLYDLSNDRHEDADLAQSRPELLESMKSTFEKEMGWYYHRSE